jgi:hypothetical protein
LVATRPLGALLCIVAIVVVVLHLFYGYVQGPRIHLAFGLPITAGVLAVCGLGFWLGWIMVTTKEAPPTPAPAVTAEESKPEKTE